MGLLDRLPPHPRPGTVARWVAVTILARAALLTVYLTLGDVQQGLSGTLGRRVVDEFSAALVALPLLGFVAWGATRWPVRGGRWRRHLLPLLGVFLVFSAGHTVVTETARWLLYPCIGFERDFGPGALALAVGHEMPNDLFSFALAVASVELWSFWWAASERERTAAELRRTLAEAQLTTLRLQLQPHFLFNALNTVSATMYDDPRRADTMIGELAELLRASLRADRGDEVALAEEVGIAERYVRLQRERFGDRLTVAFDVPPDCEGARVPVFVLQPLIENAVRHGRVERHGSGTIRVTARRHSDGLAVEVWDDGDGMHSAAGVGLGLRATAERLQLLHGEGATLVAGPADGGWRVRIEQPFRTA